MRSILFSALKTTETINEADRLFQNVIDISYLRHLTSRNYSYIDTVMQVRKYLKNFTNLNPERTVEDIFADLRWNGPYTEGQTKLVAYYSMKRKDRTLDRKPPPKYFNNVIDFSQRKIEMINDIVDTVIDGLSSTMIWYDEEMERDEIYD